jgi:hypothetical protein
MGEPAGLIDAGLWLEIATLGRQRHGADMQLGFGDFIHIVIAVGMIVLVAGTLVFVVRIARWPGGGARGKGISLPTSRVAGTGSKAQTLRVMRALISGRSVLVHLTRLAGLQVVAARTDWQTDGDGFEAWFSYKNRLFHLNRPFLVEISLLGQPASEALFAEVERYVQTYKRLTSFGLRTFLFLPSAPSPSILDRYLPKRTQAGAGKDDSTSSRATAGVDPLAEAEVYLASGRREMAIAILEDASRADPSRNDIRTRLREIKPGV